MVVAEEVKTVQYRQAPCRCARDARARTDWHSEWRSLRFDPRHLSVLVTVLGSMVMFGCPNPTLGGWCWLVA